MSGLWATLGAIITALVGFLLKFKGDAAKAEKKVVQINLEAAKAQNKAIFDANQAIDKADNKSKQEVKDAVKKAKDDDYSSLDNNW